MSENIKKREISLKKRAVFYILMAVMTLLTIVVIGETGARFWYKGHYLPEPQPPESINPYRPNPYVVNMRPYLFFHIPGARYFQKILSNQNEYHINSMGFRGPEISSYPVQGKKRLIVLGDSIVEGHGVHFDQTFSHHLQRGLADLNWEVINLGVQGASPLYFAANMERYLYLHPDAVLIVIHENDLYDDEQREKSYFDFPLLQDRAGLYSGGKIHSVATKSSLYSLLENSWHTLFTSSLEKIIAQNESVPGIHADRMTDRNISSFAVPAAKFEKRWAMSSQYLTYALNAFKDHGADVLVSSLCTVTLSFPAVQSYAAHCSNLEKHVEQWAKEQGVPHLSLVPTVQNAFNSHKITEVLILNDFHPTRMTHRLLADALYPFLVRHLSDSDHSPANNLSRPN